MSAPWILGIDFGTSNTAAAHTNPIDGSVATVSLAHDRTTMSSSVYVESTDRIDVGEVAVEKARSNPSGFIPAPKRLVPQQVFQVNGYDIKSSVPVAAILRAVIERASREHNGTRPSVLILTHPEAWSQREINVVLEAAVSLGIDPASITTISEPKAAAHYYSEANQLAPGEKIAVFDFGGGTLDVAVLEAQADGAFRVVAANGDNSLGGKSFDALLRRWVDLQLEDDDPELLTYLRKRAPLAERHALEDSIRRAKELLSESSQATISVFADGETHRFQITRSEFEQIIAPALDRAVSLTRQTLADAGIHDASGLKALYLTGGSSRIPMVQEALKPLGTIATLDDPKTVVAKGALRATTPVTPARPAATQQPAQRPEQQPEQQPEPHRNPYSPSSQPAAEATRTPPQALAEKKPRPKWIVPSAAAGVLALVGGGAYVFTQLAGGASDPGTGGAASASSINAVAAPQGTTTSVLPASGASGVSSYDEILASLPSQLRENTEKCSSATFPSVVQPKVALTCDVKSGEFADKYFRAYDPFSSNTITFAVDTAAATSYASTINDGLMTAPGNKDPEVWSKQAARASVEPGYTDGAFDLKYGDPDSGLVLHAPSVGSVAQGKVLLTDLGLL